MFDGNESSNVVEWKHLGDIEKGRKNLGEWMPVQVYRLFQYTIKNELSMELGKDKMKHLLRNAGKSAGILFAENLLDISLPVDAFLRQLQNVLEQSKIGILRIEYFSLEKGEAVMTIAEDVDCSGLPLSNEPVCNYDEGFLAGILCAYTKIEFEVMEKDCWATGAQVCRFEAYKKQR